MELPNNLRFKTRDNTDVEINYFAPDYIIGYVIKNGKKVGTTWNADGSYEEFEHPLDIVFENTLVDAVE